MILLMCYFNTMVKKLFIGLWFVMVVPLPGSGREPGVGSDFILFGQSAALSHEARYLGTNMRAGVLAAFREINQQGGLYGRKLKLVSLDDAYEPELAVQNTRLLIEKHNVFSLIGGVGTPTSKAVLPIISKKMVPYIGPFTGAEVLRITSGPVINLRSSYYQEINYMVDQLINSMSVKKISILYQDDSYGRAGLNGLKQALQKKNKSISSEGVYLRNTTAVKIALLRIRRTRPEAVIIVGAYRPVARFIQLAEELNFRPLFICLSFVGTNALRESLKNVKTPVAITQVMPPPFDSSHPLVARYQKAMGKDFNFISLEGYLVGRFAGYVLRQIGSNPTRVKFLNFIKTKKNFMVDGFPLSFGTKDNQGSDQVFLTVIKEGRLLSINHLKEMSL